MNITETKAKIAEFERQTADEIGMTVKQFNAMREAVASSLVAHVSIIARKKREIVGDRMAELRLKHAAEVLALKREIAHDLATFETAPETAVHQVIANLLNVDVGTVPNLIAGCAATEAHIKSLWAEYRKEPPV